jgi:hypothetical protein
MAYLSIEPRLLATIMGQEVLGAQIHAGSSFAGIGDTISIGHVLYDGSFPVILADKLWTPARMDYAHITIAPIVDIHIFLSETDCVAALDTTSSVL